MRIHITYPQGNSQTTLDVEEETTLSIVKALIEIELQVPATTQIFRFKNRKLLESEDELTLKDLGIKDDIQLVLSTHVPSEDSCNKSNQVFKNVFEQQKVNSVTERKASIPSPKENQLKEVHNLRDRWLRALSDPLSQEAQELMLQQIREKELDEALLHAQEYLPESFGSVSMVYVKVELNNIQLVAFIDSGAQSTVISEKCANRCGMMRHIDKRFRGMAQGLGLTKILGRIHVAQLRLGATYFAASLVVLEDSKIDFLFGLDLLRRHQCTLDFRKDILRIANEEISFLSEHEIRANLLNTSESSSDLGFTNTDATSHLRSINEGRAKQEILEARIQGLIDIGATREKAIDALVKANWSLDEAAALYFSEKEKNI